MKIESEERRRIDATFLEKTAEKLMREITDPNGGHPGSISSLNSKEDWAERLRRIDERYEPGGWTSSMAFYLDHWEKERMSQGRSYQEIFQEDVNTNWEWVKALRDQAERIRNGL